MLQEAACFVARLAVYQPRPTAVSDARRLPVDAVGVVRAALLPLEAAVQLKRVAEVQHRLLAEVVR